MLVPKWGALGVNIMFPYVFVLLKSMFVVELLLLLLLFVFVSMWSQWEQNQKKKKNAKLKCETKLRACAGIVHRESAFIIWNINLKSFFFLIILAIVAGCLTLFA